VRVEDVTGRVWLLGLCSLQIGWGNILMISNNTINCMAPESTKQMLHVHIMIKNCNYLKNIIKCMQ